MHLLSRVFATAVALVISSVSAHAGLTGKTMSAQYFYPDLSTPYALAPFVPPTFVVGPGVETVGDVEGVTTLTVDFSDSDLLLTLNTILTSPTWNSVPFNGPVFTAPSGLMILDATNIGTTLVGFDDSRISFNATQLFLNWQGLSYQDGNVVSIHFDTVTNVPEPMSITLLGAGLVAIGVARRRRRKLVS